ncbi:hypothetical protein MIMGU_mgv1a022132mg, partial [Erythranthe guttata]
LLLNTEVLFKAKQEIMYVAGENENLSESDVIKEALRHESRNTMHIAHTPERFLGNNNNNNKKSSIDFKGQDFELIQFGAGRRICPALTLADRMMHIYHCGYSD